MQAVTGLRLDDVRLQPQVLASSSHSSRFQSFTAYFATWAQVDAGDEVSARNVVTRISPSIVHPISFKSLQSLCTCVLPAKTSAVRVWLSISVEAETPSKQFAY